MTAYLTVIKINKKFKKEKFLKFAEKHWKDLKIEDDFKDYESMCAEICEKLLDKKYIGDWSGGIEGGIIFLLERFLSTKENKVVVNHKDFANESSILAIT
jgi:hypothetical protein